MFKNHIFIFVKLKKKRKTFSIYDDIMKIHHVPSQIPIFLFLF